MDMEPPNFGRLFGACSLEIFMRWWLKVIVVALMQPAWHMSSNSTNRMPDPANMSETAHEPTRRRRSAERASRALSCHSRHWGPGCVVDAIRAGARHRPPGRLRIPGRRPPGGRRACPSRPPRRRPPARLDRALPASRAAAPPASMLPQLARLLAEYLL